MRYDSPQFFLQKSAGSRMRHVAILIASLALAACATPLPTAAPEELRAASSAVIAESVRIEAVAAVCAGLDAAWQERAMLAEGTWRARHRNMLHNADAAWQANLAVQAEPYVAEKRGLSALRLRLDARREAETTVRGPSLARDAGEQAKTCEFELGHYEDGTRDIRVDAASPGLVVLALPAAIGPDEDLAVPRSGRDLAARHGIGTSLPQVDKMLSLKRCRSPLVIRMSETGTSEVYVASCENGKRFVARCELRNCTLE